ncbi:putative aldouronate transport system substrate-binding protein [Paenibacillus sp. UNCCL117]|uniref:extracellular solute-binding protein n=1 Tax=unclassified Paenibacillus TaxID=185978 RepID=UPI000881A3E5|nr:MULTISPECIES: extracellular solute-binding protein [unclassified Paenibacillus]SDC63762.1 putative aldouronate transport system substrate-binding protein [Paenibacillus sp. cl123]SFW22373.1 putative aldouronate transport system substrate-binding protein [Paenibacillus sp. UNCCL117]
MKKAVSSWLALAVGVTALAGCSGESKEPETVNKGTDSPGQVSAAPGKKTFTFLNYSNPSWPYSKDWPVWKYLEEKTGVTLEVQTPPGGKMEDALSLTMASGTLPDLMFTQTKATADKYGQQGALVNILDHVNDMPNFKKWMEKYPAAAQSAIASDGKMYVLPNQGIGETNRMIWMYREDIFKKHGLQQPATWDELYTTLKKLKELYPDSYPLTFRNGLRYLQNFGASFDVVATLSLDVPSVYYDAASKDWKYGPTQDNFKTLITYMNKFYKEKLIPPDFLTVDTKIWQDMMSTNRGFVTLDYIGRIDFYNSALRKDNPDFNLSFMAPPAGWTGGPQKNAFTQVSEEGLMISSKSKNTKDIVKYLDFFFTEEGKTLVSWGKEGETFKTENGKKVFIGDYKDVSDLRKKTGLSSDGAYAWFDYDAHISLASPELKKAYEQVGKYDNTQQPKPAFTAEEQEILSTVGDALNKNRDENLSKFILGNRSLAEWDGFVEEQKKLGIDKILSVYKQAYDRMLKATK